MEGAPKSTSPLGPFGPVLGMAHRRGYLSAAVVMGSICLISTVMTFVLSRTHNDLKQRGRYLVAWNGIAATVVVTVYLMLNAYVGDFPCFILLWTSYLFIVPWLLTYLARGWRLVFIYNRQVDFGRRSLQRNISHRNNSPLPLTQNAGNGAVEDSSIQLAQRHPLGVIMEGSLGQGLSSGSLGQPTVTGSSSPPDGQQGAVTINREESTMRFDQTESTLASSAEKPLPLLPAPSMVDETSGVSNVASINNTISQTDPRNRLQCEEVATDHERTISSPLGVGILPDTNGVVLEGVAESVLTYDDQLNTRRGSNHPVIGEEIHLWDRFLPFNQATDGRLTVFLLMCMVFPLILCLAMQFVKPSPVQINPTCYKCGEGPVFYPIYAVMLAFLAVGCPVLSYKLWWIKDGFGIRNELLVNMLIGLPGFALYFISPFRLKYLDAGHWNHVNWLTLTIFLTHVNSVVLPLIHFFQRQRPKSRSGSSRGGKPITSIFPWDSAGKSISGTPAGDFMSDRSSFLSKSSSQVMSPQLHSSEAQNDGNQSIAEQSVLSQAIAEGLGQAPLPSAGTNRTESSGHRLRGLKGFMSKYGTDSDGNLIPLGKMNPRAYEYVVQDRDMLEALVAFSVTVFSTENALFLQEYDGLRKQVREYYQLISRNSRAESQQQLADGSGPTTQDRDGSIGSQSSRPRRNTQSLLGSISSSIHHKISSIHGELHYGRRGSRAVSEPPPVKGTGPALSSPALSSPVLSSPGAEISTPMRTRPIGRHRQNLSDSLWRLSLQSSLRHSSTAPTSPRPTIILGDDPTTHSRGKHAHAQSESTPTSPRMSERQVPPHSSLATRCFPRLTVSTADPMHEYGSEEPDSERSSFSWYGRGNSGSALSYQDMTPSDVSSYQGGLEDSGEYPDSISDGSVVAAPVSADDITIRNGELGPVRSASASFPLAPRPKTRATISSQSQDNISNLGSSKSSAQSPLSPTFRQGLSIETSPYGSDPKQPSRLFQPVSTQSPFHSPSSSVSAPYTPRLPSQPQLRGSPSSLQRSSSARTILTAEEYRQLYNASSAVAFASNSGPLSVSPFQEGVRQHLSYDEALQQDSSNAEGATSQAQVPAVAVLPLSGASQGRQRMLARANSRGLMMPVMDRMTPVPKALLSAYWELADAFIMPWSDTQLNLPYEMVQEIRRLFEESQCYLEMFEPVVREIQELVYVNVWPRFVVYLQRQPRGFRGRMKQAWKAFTDRIRVGNHLGGVGYSGEDGVYQGTMSHRAQDMSMAMSEQFPETIYQDEEDIAYARQQRAQGYIQNQYSYLAGPSAIRLRSGADEGKEVSEEELGQFGVMQELDFTALERIVVDAK